MTLSNPSSQPIELSFTASDLSATAATDFDATAFEYSIDGGATWIAADNGSEVTIPAGLTAAQVRVMTTEDLTLEATERMQLSIDAVVSGLVGDTTDIGVGTIIDDDTALVSIVATDAVAGEPANNGEFTVSLSNPSHSPTVIAYSIAGTATSGADFTALTGTVTIPTGETSGTIALTVVDDLVIEGIEDVTLTLTSITSGDPHISIDPANASDTATISDDDTATWQLTGHASVNEGANATYNVSLSGTLQAGESTSVDLTILDSTTTPADYASFDTAVADAIDAYAGPGVLVWDGDTLTFTSDGTGQMAPLVIDLMAVNDAIVEGVEQYNVSISGAVSSTGIAVNIDAANNSVDTEIQDTIDAVGTSLDKATFSIAGATSVSEAGTTDYTVTIDATLQAGEVATVDLLLTNIDTTAGDITALNDAVNAAVATYNASGQPGSLSFDGTTLSFASDGTGPMGDLIVQITANADGFLEGAEDYSIGLANATSTTGAFVAIDINDTVTTTIQPDATAAEWSIGIDNAGDEGATVQYLVELTESLGAGDSAAIDLALNDVDTNSADYGDFIVAVNDAIAAYAGPGLIAFDGTTLTFTAVNDGDMMTGLTINLDLVDDALVEGVETFTVDLSNPAGPTGVNVAVSTSADSVTTTINDTIGVGGEPDSATWSITGPAAGDEGASVQYVVALDGAFGAGESVSVMLNLTDVDTTSSDYASIIDAASAAAAVNPDVVFDSITQTFTYTAPTDGASLADLVIDFGLNTDAIVEGPEDFVLALSSAASTTGAEVTIEPTEDSVTTTINDLTTPLEWAIVGPVSADEGASAQYTISLDGMLGAGEDASVVISLADLTTNSNDHGDINAAIALAINGNPNLSYDSASGTLTFVSQTDGDTMPPITVDLEIVNDDFIEGTELFNIALLTPSSSSGAATTVSITNNNVTTEINDTQGAGLAPDFGRWVLTGDTTVSENGVASYTLALEGQFGEGEAVSIDIGLADIATTSDDYLNFVAAVNAAVDGYAGDGTVTFDGTTVRFTAVNEGDRLSDLTIDLAAVDDVLVEGDENYQIAISNPASTTGSEIVTGIGFATTDTIVTTTIIDDDSATWSLSGSSTVDEGAIAQYTIALAGTLQANETALIDVGLTDVDTNSADYADFVAAVNSAVAARADLTFDGTTLTYTGDGSPMVDLIVDLSAVDDSLAEGPESYSIDLSNPTSTTGSTVAGAGLVTTMILDNDALLWNITGTNNVDEGGLATYKISLDGELQIGEQASVRLTLANLETDSADYDDFVAAVQAAVSARSDLTFDAATEILTVTGAGVEMADLFVELMAVDDAFIEGPERFQIMLADASSSTGLDTDIDPAVSIVNTTINDTVSDGGEFEKAVWSLGFDQTVAEGDAGAYTLSLSGSFQTGEVASVDLSLTDVDTISADHEDFDSAIAAAVAAYTGPGSLSWDGTSLSFTSDGTGPMNPLSISLGTTDDAFDEGTENFLISLSNANSVTGSLVCIDSINDGAVTTIDDTIGDGIDRAVWSLTGDGAVDEGGTASYVIGLAGGLGAGESASVDLLLADINTNSSDYANFDSAVAAAVADYNSSGNPGVLSWDGTSLTFEANADGDAFAGITVELGAQDDAFLEGPEQYQVSLSNAASATGLATAIDPIAHIVVTTISDTIGDGGPPELGGEWSVVGSPSVVEGGAINYSIELSGNLQAGEATTVQVTKSDIETSDSDHEDVNSAITTAVGVYNAIASNPGSLSFDGTFLTFTSDGTGPMGGLDFSVGTVDDLIVEGNERVNLSLSNPMSSTGLSPTLSPTQSIATTMIIDNDLATWSITGDATVVEGADAQYVVNLAGTLQAGETASIDLSIGDVDTTSTDYASFVTAVNDAVAAYAGPGALAFDGTTLTFTSDGTGPMAGLQVSLSTTNDAFAEGLEDFQISLSDPTSSTGSAIEISTVADDVVTTIDDTVGPGADQVVWSIVGDGSVDEGGTATYTVSITNSLAAGADATVDLSIGDVDTNSDDYANFSAAVVQAVAGYNAGSNPGSLTWNGTTLVFTADVDGDTLTGLVIELDAIDDAFLEGPEVYDIALTNPGSGSGILVDVNSTLDNVSTTINDTDGDGGPAEQGGEWSIQGPTIVGEGTDAAYTVALDGVFQASEVASIDLSLTDIDTTSSDYGDLIAAVNAAVKLEPGCNLCPCDWNAYLYGTCGWRNDGGSNYRAFDYFGWDQ